MTSYYRMHDPIKGQQLLYQLVEMIIHRYVGINKPLNPEALPYEPKNELAQDIKKNNSLDLNVTAQTDEPIEIKKDLTLCRY